jgi:hypothetical protein
VRVTDTHKLLEGLSNELRLRALQPHTEVPNPQEKGVIYHYTTAAGLQGILNSGSLWATNLWCLSDAKEVQYPHDFCLQYLLDKSRNCCTAMLPLVERAIKILDVCLTQLFPYEYQFSVSFSLDGDLESQWREYANDGFGYAIGFESMALLSKFSADCCDPNSCDNPNFIFFRMLYKPEKQRAVLDSQFEAVEEQWPILKHSPSPNKYDMLHNVACSLIVHMARASTCFKNPQFKSEREIRALYANTLELKTAGAKLDVGFHNRNGQLVTFRELKAGLGALDLMPIAGIGLGPSLDPVRARIPLIQILETKGYTGDNLPEIFASCHNWR